MAVSRTNFRAGDRVRGAEWFDEIAGAVGTVFEVEEVRGDNWAAQDLTVRFDRPVVIFDRPQWTFSTSAHNFEYIEQEHAPPPQEEHTDPMRDESMSEEEEANSWPQEFFDYILDFDPEFDDAEAWRHIRTLRYMFKDIVFRPPPGTYMSFSDFLDTLKDMVSQLPPGTNLASLAELSAAKQELEERSALIEALKERAERVRIVQDLERERMARADLESRLSRA